MFDIYSNESAGSGYSIIKYYLILFLLWPFLAFVTAVTNFHQKEAKKVIYIFLIYLGLFFVITPGMDSWTQALRFRETAQLPFTDFFKIVGGIYAADTSVDIVQPLLNFIVSRFTDEHSFLYAVYAAFFGFFYLKSIDLLYKHYRINSNPNGLLHLLFLAALIPVTSINGFRMWTAAWIFFYGAYHVITKKDPRFFIITFGASLVHFSFLTANAVLVIYYFMGNRNIIYIIVLILSFILPQLLTPYFQKISILLGGGFQSRFDMYADEDVLILRAELNKQAAWFMTVGKQLVLYYVILAITIVKLRYKNLMNDRAESNLFSFLLLFLAFVNFGKSIASLGSRFEVIFFMFAVSYLIFFFSKINHYKLNFWTLTSIFPLLLYAAIVFRQGSDSINAWIFSPGCGLPFFYNELSLTEVLFPH